MERRIAVLERSFTGGCGWDWNDDELRREVRRMALEHGLGEAELYAESVWVLEFARERGLAVGSEDFAAAYLEEVRR